MGIMALRGNPGPAPVGVGDGEGVGVRVGVPVGVGDGVGVGVPVGVGVGVGVGFEFEEELFDPPDNSPLVLNPWVQPPRNAKVIKSRIKGFTSCSLPSESVAGWLCSR